VNLVAVISGGSENGLAEEVTAKNHEDVPVFPDQLLPHLLAVVAFELQAVGGSRLISPQVGVRQDNDTVVRMLGNCSVRPIQDFVAGVVLKSDNKKLQPCGLEVVPGIVMAIRMAGAAKLAPFCEFLARKVGVEMRGPVDTDITAILIVRLLKTHVMVSQAHAVGNFPVQYRHCFLCDGPFLGGVGLHDVSFVDEKADIESIPIVTHPAGLLEKVAA